MRLPCLGEGLQMDCGLLLGCVLSFRFSAPLTQCKLTSEHS